MHVMGAEKQRVIKTINEKNNKEEDIGKKKSR
jgi:hypothetical protein